MGHYVMAAKFLTRVALAVKRLQDSSIHSDMQ
jgi:hypothetical protein